jgi:hypoxanthine phosphoribosyltransferase
LYPIAILSILITVLFDARLGVVLTRLVAILLGILKGSFIFLADLVRKLDFPLEVQFIRLSSYGSGQQSSGSVKVAPGLCPDVKGRHVVVVEDIVDTGVTLAFLLEYLEKKKSD